MAQSFPYYRQCAGRLSRLDTKRCAFLEADSVTRLRGNYKTLVESGALCPLLCLWWVYHLNEAICY